MVFSKFQGLSHARGTGPRSLSEQVVFIKRGEYLLTRRAGVKVKKSEPAKASADTLSTLSGPMVGKLPVPNLLLF